jgi:hypothetical protein
MPDSGWPEWFPIVADNWPRQLADCSHTTFEAQRARGNSEKRRVNELKAGIVFALRPFIKVSVSSRGKR